MSYVRLYGDWQRTVQAASDPGVRDKAEAVLTMAIYIAPVDTGEYMDSLELVKLPGGGYRVQALADHSIFVEFGTYRMRPFHTLATALQAAKG